MPREQFEKELSHLERVVPLLAGESALGLPYWRSRVASLSADQALVPDGVKRVARLLKLFAEIERMS
jgi:hypothetical protein